MRSRHVEAPPAATVGPIQPPVAGPISRSSPRPQPSAVNTARAVAPMRSGDASTKIVTEGEICPLPDARNMGVPPIVMSTSNQLPSAAKASACQSAPSDCHVAHGGALIGRPEVPKASFNEVQGGSPVRHRVSPTSTPRSRPSSTTWPPVVNSTPGKGCGAQPARITAAADQPARVRGREHPFRPEARFAVSSSMQLVYRPRGRAGSARAPCRTTGSRPTWSSAARGGTP